MTEYNEIFDVVLYYKRKVFVKPTEPIFGDVQKENTNLDTDGVLDLYSVLSRKYKEDLKKYESVENKGMTVLASVLIPEDDNFIENYLSIENDLHFIEWDKNSEKLIKSTVSKLNW